MEGRAKQSIQALVQPEFVPKFYTDTTIYHDLGYLVGLHVAVVAFVLAE